MNSNLKFIPRGLPRDKAMGDCQGGEAQLSPLDQPGVHTPGAVKNLIKILAFVSLIFLFFPSVLLAGGDGSVVFNGPILSSFRNVDLPVPKVNEFGQNLSPSILIDSDPFVNEIKQDREYGKNILMSIRESDPDTSPLIKFKEEYDKKLVNFKEEEEAKNSIAENEGRFVENNIDMDDEYGERASRVKIILFLDGKEGILDKSTSEKVERSFAIDQAMMSERKEEANKDNKDTDKEENEDEEQFDPETADFSKMQTIKTWVAERFHRDEKMMFNIQGIVSKFVPQNPKSEIYSGQPIIVSEEESGKVGGGNFGYTFATIESIELPFLQFVNKVSKSKFPITLEIACGPGYVSLKVPLSFEKRGIHCANDISSKALEKLGDYLEKAYGGRGHVKKVKGDCFKKLNFLQGKVDAIYVQNLEHFFNPKQHQKFIGLINSLLVPGGRAFLCAHSFDFGRDINHPLYKDYQKQRRRGNMYPGFVKYIKKDGGRIFVLESNISKSSLETEEIEVKEIKEVKEVKEEYCEVCRPDDDANVFGYFRKKSSDNGTFLYIMRNYFSPKIYREAIKPFSSLEVRDAFFIDSMGKKRGKWNDSGHGREYFIRFAAVIVEKKKK